MTEYDVVIFIFQNFDISTYYGDFQIVMDIQISDSECVFCFLFT